HTAAPAGTARHRDRRCAPSRSQSPERRRRPDVPCPSTARPSGRPRRSLTVDASCQKPVAESCFMSIRFRLIIAAAVALALAAGAAPQAQQDLVARARAIHGRVITLDTHNDIDPRNFTDSCNYTMRLTTQVNLPKMKEGGLDVSFFIVYVGQGDLSAA